MIPHQPHSLEVWAQLALMKCLLYHIRAILFGRSARQNLGYFITLDELYEHLIERIHFDNFNEMLRMYYQFVIRPNYRGTFHRDDDISTQRKRDEKNKDILSFWLLHNSGPQNPIPNKKGTVLCNGGFLIMYKRWRPHIIKGRQGATFRQINRTNVDKGDSKKHYEVHYIMFWPLINDPSRYVNKGLEIEAHHRRMRQWYYKALNDKFGNNFAEWERKGRRDDLPLPPRRRRETNRVLAIQHGRRVHEQEQEEQVMNQWQAWWAMLLEYFVQFIQFF